MKLRTSSGGSDAARLARGVLALVFVVIAAGQSNFICPGVKTILDKPEELKNMTLRNTACLNGHSEQCQPIAPAYCSPKDRCLMAPCLHGATCHTAPGYTYYCSCPPLYTGDNCETFDPCLSTPCQNGGTCTPSDDGTYSCSCGPKVTGVNCETSEWITNAARYYYVSTTECTHGECRTICQSIGADLITIDSDEEMAFAASIARSRRFWLSIYKTTETLPGTWVVNPDSTQQITYTNWVSGQPDTTNYRCAFVDRNFGYEWFDYGCNDVNLLYICEK